MADMSSLRAWQRADSASPARPLVSVIVPACNPRPDWLQAAISSALKEPDCRVEVIIVDDASDVPVAVPPAADDQDVVRVIRLDVRGGPSRARNVALRHIRGDFVRFLDDDDEFVAGSTSLLLSLCAGRKDVVAYGSTVETDPLLRPMRRISSRLSGSVHVETAMGRFHVMVQGMLIPREVLEVVGPWRESLFVQGDWEFALRVTELAQVTGTREPVHLWRRYSTSHSSRRDARRHAVKSTAVIIREYLGRHPELAGTRTERRIRAYAQFLIGKLRDPRYPLGSQRFWRAIATDPLRGSVILASRLASEVVRRLRPRDRNPQP